MADPMRVIESPMSNEGVKRFLRDFAEFAADDCVDESTPTATRRYSPRDWHELVEQSAFAAWKRGGQMHYADTYRTVDAALREALPDEAPEDQSYA